MAKIKYSVIKVAEFRCYPFVAFIDHEFVEEIKSFIRDFRESNPGILQFMHPEIEASNGKTKMTFWNISPTDQTEFEANAIGLVSRIAFQFNVGSIFIYDGNGLGKFLEVRREEIE